MKTAKEYLYAVMGCEPVHSRMDYNDALEAVQAAIDDAASVRQQVAQGIADYFGDIMPLPELPALPADAPRIRLGCCRKCGEARQQCANTECPGASPFPRVFPPACTKCLQRPDQCVCPTREEPPF